MLDPSMYTGIPVFSAKVTALSSPLSSATLSPKIRTGLTDFLIISLILFI